MLVYVLLDFSGGILGWDPVLTTCIHGRSLGRTMRHHTRRNNVNHHGDHEKYCEAIYWKYHTSHILTKKSIKILLNNYFLSEIQFLLVLSKIPYYSSEEDILVILITPLIIFL